MITPCYEIEELDAYRPAKPAFAEALCSNDSNPTCVHNCLCMVQGVGQIREVKNAVIRIFPWTTGGMAVFDLDLTPA